MNKPDPALAGMLQLLSEIDRDMTDLARDVLDLKDSSDGSVDLLGLQSKVSSAQLAITQVRVEIDKLINPEPETGRPGAPKSKPPGSKNESTEDPTAAVTLALVKCGYSRDMHAPVNEIRYSHPTGHQVHIRVLPEGYHWRHFPPGLRGEVSKGYAAVELQQHLDRVHRRDMTEAARKFSVTQVDADPLERYLIREDGDQYPAIVQHNPADGTWHCYTCAPNLRDGPDYDVHLEAAKRWVQKGKPSAVSGEPSGSTGAEPSNQGFDVPTGLPDQ